MIKLPKFGNNNYYETFKTIKLPKFGLSIYFWKPNRTTTTTRLWWRWNYRNSDRPISFSKAKQKRPFRLVSFISYLNTRSVYCLKIYLNQVNSKTSFLRIGVKTSFSCPFFWRPGHVESFPDLEMNSAQVDFERPRCWILALSWNELSSGRLWMSTLLNHGLILKWTQLRLLFLDFERPRCWTQVLSWNELSSGRLFRLWTSKLLNPGLILKWT